MRPAALRPHTLHLDALSCGYHPDGRREDACHESEATDE